jgi:glycosyltransferase involved in cell wall biosynthesis
MRSVDVLIPFHSDSEYLWEAIDSILDSRGVAVRILLINDIEDAEVSAKFQVQIERYLNVRDVNFSIIRNQGRSYATSLNVSRAWIQSDFVAILNSDDLSTPYRLQSQVQALEKSGAELAIGKIVKFHGKLRLPSMSGALNPSSLSWQHILLGAYGSDASIVVTRKAWLEHFIFDEFSRRSDWATALKIYPHLKIIGVDQAVYKYRIHGLQMTQSQIQISDDFPSYFSFWRGLNTSLGLPDVSLNIARALSQPWAKQKLNKDEFKMMQIWCLKFEKLLLDVSVSNETKSLLGRRLIISGPIIFSVIQRPLLLTRMIFEFLFIRIIGSRTRS